jgi:hypothetical protein
MILLLTGIFLGSLLGYLLCRLGEKAKIANLEFDKEMLLDFNEKLIRDRDEIEARYSMTFHGYVNHLDTHVCVRVVEDRVLEAEFVE